MKQIKIVSLIVIFFAIATVGFSTNVGTVLDLWNVRGNLSGSYTQTADINLETTAWNSGTSYTVGALVIHGDYAYYCTTANSDNSFVVGNWAQLWEAAKGWKPIGTVSSPFTGVYDGGGYTISNLYINRGANASANNVYPSDGEDNIGLFGYVTNGSSANAVIKNVGLINPKVTGRRATGSLIGKVMIPSNALYKVITSNCYAQGDGDSYIKGFGATGGLVGANNSNRRQQVPVIQFCWTNMNVSSTHPENTASNSSDNGNAYNIKYGGVVGCNETGVTFDSYATGNITGGDRVGGVAGCAIDGAVIRCYATGNVTQNIVSSPTSGVGHVVGAISGKLPPGLGGFSGSGTVQQCYYPINPAPTVTTVSGQTANSLATQIAFSDSTNFVGFDPEVWNFASAEPWLPTLKGTIGTTLPLYYYYTFGDGNWNAGTSVWKRTSEPGYTGGSSTSVVPDMFNSLGIKILHAINLNLDVEVDNMLIASGGKLTILADYTLTVQNGANTGEIDDSDLVVEDSLKVNGTLLLGSSATAEITDNGVLTIGASGSIDPGVASNFITDSDNVDYTNIGVDGYSSINSRFLKFPPTNKLIKPFNVSISTPSTNMPQHINRQWEISGTALETETKKSMTFYWNAADDGYYNWFANGATPVVYFSDNAYNPSAYDISSDPRWVTVEYTFSTGTKGRSSETVKIGRDGAQTLPVELSAFNAQSYQGRSIKLMWQTQSETNVQGFSFYRGRSNILEDALYLNVNIAGTNSSQPKSYIYYDREIFEPGIYYYWLLSTDFDGTSQIFGPINVYFDAADSGSGAVTPIPGFAAAYPNPFNPETTLRYGVDQKSLVEILIYNVRGQIVRKLMSEDKDVGWHQIRWDGRDDSGRILSSGVYFARMHMGDKLYQHKIVMMK